MINGCWGLAPIDWIYDLHLVAAFGPAAAPGETTDDYGTAVHDVFFTFSNDRNAFAIDVAWFRASGDIIPWKKSWVGNDTTQP